MVGTGTFYGASVVEHERDSAHVSAAHRSRRSVRRAWEIIIDWDQLAS